MIAGAESILITSHASPDGDSIGSQLALYDYIINQRKKVELINQDSIPYMYRFLPGIDCIKNIETNAPKNKFDLAFVLDCSSMERTGQVLQLLDRKTKVINIDHHPDNNKFGNIALWDSEASSTAEILTEFLLGSGWPISKDTAVVLYSAIMTDTGRFRFESTGRRTMELAGLLIELGANPRKISDNIYFSIPPAILKLTGNMLGGAQFYNDGKICIMEVSQAIMQKYGSSISDLDSLAEYTLYAKDVTIGALLKELDSTCTKVSLRSKDTINVSQVAHKFGGGGHRNASGFVANLSLEESRRELLENLKGMV